jgi:hypothetical protein
MWRVGILLLCLVGCSDWNRPTGPTTTVEGNTGPVTIIVPTGSANSGGIGPCGATVNGGSAPACPTKITTTTNPPPAAAAEARR